VGDLVAVLEAVGPCVLVGHSWGGLLAQLAAWERPDLITGLVLIDPSHESLWSDFLTPEALAEASRHPIRPAADDPRSADVLPSARELATEIADGVGSHQDLLIDACLSYVETDEQLFTILDEVPMALAHLDDLAVRRARGVSTPRTGENKGTLVLFWSPWGPIAAIHANSHQAATDGTAGSWRQPTSGAPGPA
jgi:pimeloyl-ACP methyl ester carboxylesterase